VLRQGYVAATRLRSERPSDLRFLDLIEELLDAFGAVFVLLLLGGDPLSQLLVVALQLLVELSRLHALLLDLLALLGMLHLPLLPQQRLLAYLLLLLHVLLLLVAHSLGKCLRHLVFLIDGLEDLVKFLSPFKPGPLTILM